MNTALQKTLGRANKTVLETRHLLVQFWMICVWHTPSEFDKMDPLTLAHLLSGRRITPLPYESVYNDKVDDPNIEDESNIRWLAKQQAQTLQHSISWWKQEYLTSLQKFHKTITGYGKTKQKTAVGDVVLVQDDIPQMYWKLAVVEEFIIECDGLVRAAHIRTMNGRTYRPFSNLCPLRCAPMKLQQRMQ